jgi:hypothetical protein
LCIPGPPRGNEYGYVSTGWGGAGGQAGGGAGGDATNQNCTAGYLTGSRGGGGAGLCNPGTSAIPGAQGTPGVFGQATTPAN